MICTAVNLRTWTYAPAFGDESSASATTGALANNHQSMTPMRRSALWPLLAGSGLSSTTAHDPLRPLGGWGSRRLQFSLTDSKRPVRAVALGAAIHAGVVLLAANPSLIPSP